MKIEDQICSFEQALRFFNLLVDQGNEIAVFSYDKNYPTQPPRYKQTYFAVTTISCFTLCEMAPIVNYILEETNWSISNNLEDKYKNQSDYTQYNPKLLADIILEAIETKEISVKKVNEILRRN